jgi:hypothetical protein
VERMGLGQLGFNYEELYDLTPRAFYNAQAGLYERWEVDSQGDWERARWMACVIVNPHVKKNLNPKDLTKFPWERKRTKKDSAQVYKEAELFRRIVEKRKQMGKGYSKGKKKGTKK